jgi:AbrB family looped-hinge helix DNA binding protein
MSAWPGPTAEHLAQVQTLWHVIRTMPNDRSIEVTVGAHGRVVIPAQLRRRLGIEPGDVLIARDQDDRLVLERQDAIFRKS